MDQETQKVYESYFTLFSSPGWKQFALDLEESLKDISDIRNLKDAKELHRAQGKVELIENILNMDNMMELAFEQAKEQSSDA